MDVAELGRLLIKHNFLAANAVVKNGSGEVIFEKNVMAAVKRFQLAAGLSADGLARSSTIKALLIWDQINPEHVAILAAFLVEYEYMTKADLQYDAAGKNICNPQMMKAVVVAGMKTELNVGELIEAALCWNGTERKEWKELIRLLITQRYLSEQDLKRNSAGLVIGTQVVQKAIRQLQTILEISEDGKATSSLIESLKTFKETETE